MDLRTVSKPSETVPTNLDTVMMGNRMVKAVRMARYVYGSRFVCSQWKWKRGGEGDDGVGLAG